MDCCSGGENEPCPENQEQPGTALTSESVDQTNNCADLTAKNQSSNESTPESVDQTDNSAGSSAKDQPSTKSTTESVDQTDNSAGSSAKDQPSTKSTSGSVDQTDNSEGSSAKDQPSIKSTPESVDQTDCASLSADIQNLVLLDELQRSPDIGASKDDINTSEDKTARSCDKESINEPEISNNAESYEPSTGTEIAEEPVGNECNQRITLIDLPTEVILQLCSHLDSRFLINTLRIVCRRLNSILSDDFIWRSRIMRTWTQFYPAIPTSDDDTVDWRDSCLHLEDQKNLWSNKDRLMRHTTWKNTHYSNVDSVILVNNGTVCVSGSRDHTLAVWDVENFNEKPLAHKEAHKAWTWRLAADSNSTFYSCSFDNTLKLWTLEEDLRSTSMFDCKCPVMSIASAPNFAAAALQNNQVCFFDPRVFDAPISTYKLIKGFGLVLGILCDSHTPDLVVTGDQTGCVSVWDIRAGKMLKDIPKVKSKVKPTLQTPLSMSLRKDSCYIGDSKGQLHLMDPRRESETAFEIVATYEPGQSRLKINAVSHGKGYLFSGGQDKLLYVFSPTHEPEIITSIPLEAEITSMDYQNNTLVVGCENAVEAYKPITPL